MKEAQQEMNKYWKLKSIKNFSVYRLLIEYQAFAAADRFPQIWGLQEW